LTGTVSISVYSEIILICLMTEAEGYEPHMWKLFLVASEEQ